MRARMADALMLPGVVATILLAWVAMIALERSSYRAYLGHDVLESADAGRAWVLLALLATWTVMIAAMMLPANLPAFARYRRLAGARVASGGRSAALVLGYLSVWVLVGAALYLADLALHVAVASHPALERYAWLIGPVVVALAGVHQSAAARQRRLSTGGPGPAHGAAWLPDAFRAGLHQGTCCAYLSWPLMLVMFAFGHGSVVWMLALAALMTAERTTGWGRRLSPSLGTSLLVAAPALVLVRFLV